MITSKQAIQKYGDPSKDQKLFEETHMIIYELEEELLTSNTKLPKKIYCNKELKPILMSMFNDLLYNKLLHEIRSYDGCFCIRKKKSNNTLSLHSFGIAIDFNAKDNPFGYTKEQCLEHKLVPFSEEFVNICRKYLNCGWDWNSFKDGMHFQLKSI